MARFKDGAIRVDGLDELNWALRRMGPEFKSELRKTNKSVAAFVADDGRAAAYSLGGVAAHVAPSIKASAGAAFAAVAFGGPAYPMAGGAEFGAKNFKQFKPWKGNDHTAGYFIYPAIRADQDRIQTEYTKALDDLLKRVGLA